MYNQGMRNRLRIVLFLGVILALGLLAVFWWGAPRLLWVLPAADARDVGAAAQVRLIFSRPLQPGALEQSLSFDPSVPGSYEWQGSALIFTPSHAWPAGATVKVTLRPGIPASGFPPLALRAGMTWSFKVRQPDLAYLFPSDGPANLYLINPASGESSRLTDSPDGVLDYAVSPDGADLYFSQREGAGGSAIYRLRLAGEGEAPGTPVSPTPESALPSPQRVLACARAICQGLALDLQGRFLAYERSALPGDKGPQFSQVWVLPLSQGDPFLVAEPGHETVQPRWSSKGLLALYDKTAQAYLFVVPGGPVRGQQPNQTGEGGAWRPDGVAFLAPEINYLDANVSSDVTGLASLADSHLIQYNLDTGKTVDLTPAEGIEDVAPAYSPDGEFLAFARKYLDAAHWTPGRQLWIARADSREARQLTDDPLYNHFDFAWSPSGDQIAFVRFDQSALTEPPEIWVFDALSNQATRLVQGGYTPLWIP